ARQRRMSRDQAGGLFGLSEQCAGYGFNSSHSTGYGASACQAAYLKAHYPEEFLAARLSCGMESSDRIAEHTDDCRRMGIAVLPPDVNRSDVEFTVIVEEATSPETEPTRKISFGLGAVKGIGESAMHAMVAERTENGAFKDIFDLCERVDAKQLTKG